MKRSTKTQKIPQCSQKAVWPIKAEKINMCMERSKPKTSSKLGRRNTREVLKKWKSSQSSQLMWWGNISQITTRTSLGCFESICQEPTNSYPSTVWDYVQLETCAKPTTFPCSTSKLLGTGLSSVIKTCGWKIYSST